MDQIDQERWDSIAGALGERGIDSFLIIGLRRRPGLQPDEREAFYCRSENWPSLLAAINKVLSDCPDMAMLFNDASNSVFERQKDYLASPGGPPGKA